MTNVIYSAFGLRVPPYIVMEKKGKVEEYSVAARRKTG